MRFLAFLLFFPIFTSLAQTPQYLTDLKDEISFLLSKNLKIKRIVVNTDYKSWLILYEDFGFSYENLPNSAADYLKSLNKQQKIIKDFAFYRDTHWVCIYEKNGFAYNKISKNLLYTLQDLNNKAKNIRKLIIYKNKWVVLFGKNGIYGRLPLRMEMAVYYLIRDNKKIKDIVFFKNGWLILFQKNGYIGKNIPNQLEKNLFKLNKADKTINLVAVFGQYFLIIYDNNQLITNF